MKYRFEVLVSLKEGLADPQGRTVQEALPTLGWAGVSDVRVGKRIELSVEAASEPDARAQIEEMARRFLSNPVIEDFRVLEAADGGPP